MIIPFMTVAKTYLKHDMKILLKWFRINSLQANPGKFQIIILGKIQQSLLKLIINSTKK